MGFFSLLDVLKEVQLRHPALKKRLIEAEAFDRWSGVVGPTIAKYARPVRILDGVLWVEVQHPIWKTELLHRKRQILDLLNQGRPPLSDERPEVAPAETPLSDIRFVDPKGSRS